MAKKSRRARRQQPVRRPRPAPRPAETPQPGSKQVAAADSTARSQVDFSREYRYVIDDLRSMAVIAVAMLGVLIALSFVIR